MLPALATVRFPSIDLEQHVAVPACSAPSSSTYARGVAHFPAGSISIAGNTLIDKGRQTVQMFGP